MSETDFKECLVIGAEGSGKSLLVRKMKELEEGKQRKSDYDCFNPSTQPTVGVDLINLKWKDQSFKLRELGAAISSRWSAYYSECDLVIFTVDTADCRTWSTSLVQLYELNAHKEGWANKHLLIVCAKADISDVAAQGSCLSYLRLPNKDLDKVWKSITIQIGSCLEDKLGLSALDWLSSSR